MANDGYIRIGELSRRVGVSPELLRAWERRYGILEPGRSAGRFRLYSDADVARVQSMQANLAQGLSAAEAARRALEQPVTPEVAAPLRGSLLEPAVSELWSAVDTFDDARAHAALDRLLAAFGLETVLRDVVLPFLRELGDRWAGGEVTVAQEHFASNLLRGRLLALARGWNRGPGPHAVLAAAPGELHDLGLVTFGLALRERGWSITFLGADTPVPTVADAAERVSAELVVVTATTASPLRAVADDLASIGKRRRLALAGAGASPAMCELAHAEFLDADPIEAARALADARPRMP